MLVTAYLLVRYAKLRVYYKVEFLLMNSGHVMLLFHSALAAAVLEFLIPLVKCFVCR
jgi:hypothetical protein